MKSVANIVIYTLLWVFIAGFIIFFDGKADQHYAQTTLESIDIRISQDVQRSFLTPQDIEDWLIADSVATKGTPLARVDIARIEQSIREYECIEWVGAYMTFGGVLVIDVVPRNTLLHIRCEGYDCYATAKAEIFSLPQGKSIYSPVVSGSYRPPFESGFSGSAKSLTDSLVEFHAAEIKRLEEEKKPLEEKITELDKKRRRIAKQRVEQYDDEPDSEYKKRVEYKQEEKRQEVREVRYRQRLIGEEIAKLREKQAAEQKEQKKLLKRYEDFTKLITFVEYIEGIPFWKSEIVQIEAYSTSSNELALRLVPRSGRFIIEFGTPDNIETKFANLSRFYNEGLTNVGWDEFRRVSVEYSGKVVCSK